MAEHQLANQYPVALATMIHMAAAGAVSVMWATVPDPTVNLIASAVTAVIMAVVGLAAHSRVTPLKGSWGQQVREMIDASLQDALSQLAVAVADTAAPPAQPAAQAAAAPTRAMHAAWGAPSAATPPRGTSRS